METLRKRYSLARDTRALGASRRRIGRVRCLGEALAVELRGRLSVRAAVAVPRRTVDGERVPLGAQRPWSAPLRPTGPRRGMGGGARARLAVDGAQSVKGAC